MSEDLASNRKARHEYLILQTFEAGMVLTGTEVKSAKAGRISIQEGFGRVEHGEVFLYNCDINHYEHGNRFNHEPKRKRKLLLHAAEIRKLYELVSVKGHTLVPLRMYLKKGLVKIELALAKGKNLYDKRETLKRKTIDRETSRTMNLHRQRKK
ncbi:MAG: SsrA-binding protein SmpB [Verrucomicrobiae bacterium]|nr:SsrA-binding protein SmpB [Verrucomicrobiae bacterium]